MVPPPTSATTPLADRRTALPDIQATAPAHAFALPAVGVRSMRLPLALDTGDAIATLQAHVDLPAEQRGAHMSRFRRAIDAVPAGLSPVDFADALARELLSRHGYACRAEVELRVETAVADLVLPVVARARAGEPAPEPIVAEAARRLGLRALGSTVCPCALAMSGDRHSHVQRAELTVELADPSVGVAELHALCAGAFSAPVSTMLDRPAEKALVERMFAHPRFVEDVVREAVSALRAARAGAAARVEATAFESIHPYDCFARWEGEL